MRRPYADNVYVAEPFDLREADLVEPPRRFGRIIRFLLDESTGAASGYVLTCAFVATILFAAVGLVGRAFEDQFEQVHRPGPIVASGGNAR